MEVIEQALYGTAPGKGYGFLAASAGFLDAWKAPAEKLCTSYGERPAGVNFSGALFALPLVQGQIAIVEVRDKGNDDHGRPGTLEFRILAVPVALYRDVGGDPFWIASRFPPAWANRDHMAGLPLTSPPPERTTALLRPILLRDDSALLLGGAQGLLDGSRLFLTRSAPAPDLVRGLWELLPSRSRETMWPCTFTFLPRPEFHVQVAPPGQVMPPHMLTEDQAADYPEGRYELALQVAIETSDERELARLLQRASRQQMLWLALVLLGLFLLVPISTEVIPSLMRMMEPTLPLELAPDGSPGPPRITAITSPQRPTFDNEVVPALPDKERLALAAQLRDLAQRRGFTLPPGDSVADITRQLEALDDQLPATGAGRKLQREALERFVPRLVGQLTGGRPLGVAVSVTAGGAGQLRDQGPIERQLRVLLWKHGSPDYRLQGPNTLELLEKLEARLR